MGMEMQRPLAEPWGWDCCPKHWATSAAGSAQSMGNPRAQGLPPYRQHLSTADPFFWGVDTTWCGVQAYWWILELRRASRRAPLPAGVMYGSESRWDAWLDLASNTHRQGQRVQGSLVQSIARHLVSTLPPGAAERGLTFDRFRSSRLQLRSGSSLAPRGTPATV